MSFRALMGEQLFDGMFGAPAEEDSGFIKVTLTEAQRKELEAGKIKAQQRPEQKAGAEDDTYKGVFKALTNGPATTARPAAITAPGSQSNKVKPTPKILKQTVIDDLTQPWIEHQIKVYRDGGFLHDEAYVKAQKPIFIAFVNKFKDGDKPFSAEVCLDKLIKIAMNDEKAVDSKSYLSDSNFKSLMLELCFETTNRQNSPLLTAKLTQIKDTWNLRTATAPRSQRGKKVTTSELPAPTQANAPAPALAKQPEKPPIQSSRPNVSLLSDDWLSFLEGSGSATRAKAPLPVAAPAGMRKGP